MKKSIAILSDIHSNVRALEAVLADIKNKQITEIYCTGDSVGYNTNPNEVLNKMREQGICSVMGNHDQKVASFDKKETTFTDKFDQSKWTYDKLTSENVAFLNDLPMSFNIDFCGKRILVSHGSPNSNSEYIFYEDTEKQELIASETDADILIFGHTHNFYTKNVGDKLFINAGSVGRPKDGDNRAGYVVLSCDDDMVAEYVRVSYDNESLAKEIEASELPNSFAEVIRTGKA